MSVFSIVSDVSSCQLTDQRLDFNTRTHGNLFVFDGHLLVALLPCPRVRNIPK